MAAADRFLPAAGPPRGACSTSPARPRAPAAHPLRGSGHPCPKRDVPPYLLADCCMGSAALTSHGTGVLYWVPYRPPYRFRHREGKPVGGETPARGRPTQPLSAR
ncbi:hypothetical protein GCM10018953_73460 [Streptosporangium nondiastaticum]